MDNKICSCLNEIIGNTGSGKTISDVVYKLHIAEECLKGNIAVSIVDFESNKKNSQKEKM